jgi:hypothetical protein
MPNLCQKQKVEIIEINKVFIALQRAIRRKKSRIGLALRLWVTKFVSF